MRRLVLEFDVDEVSRFMGDISVDKLELMEVLTFLNEGPDTFALICRVRLKNASAGLSGVIKDPEADLQVLSNERDGSYVIFVKMRKRAARMGFGGYFVTPYEIRDGKVKVTFLGQPNEIRRFLKMVDKAGVKYRVDLLTEAMFSPDSPISRLTDKQRRALVTAYSQGYYDIPRRIDTDKLAKQLKIRNPTFVMHRRKAEKAILGELLSKAESNSR